MNFLTWIGAGLVGGLAGAAIWAGISYATNYEIGYIAWGIGGVVGIMVRVAAGEQNEGAAPGLVAAIVAIGSVIIGKFAAVYLATAGLASGAAEIEPMTATDMIVRMADEIIKERQSKGQAVVFPNGKSLDTASEQADYPADVWQQASANWNAIPPAEQTKQLDDETSKVRREFAEFTSSLRSGAFASSFGIFDLLWFFLAAGTAYKLGAGNVSDD